MGLLGQITLVVLAGGSGVFTLSAGFGQLRTYGQLRRADDPATVDAETDDPRELLKGAVLWTGLGLLFLVMVVVGILTGVEPSDGIG